MTTPPMRVVEVLLPNHLPRAFDYRITEEMQVQPGDYVLAPFGKRELNGVVWGEGKSAVDSAKLKTLLADYPHLPPMPKPLRDFIDWVAWYTLSPRGAVLKMSLPVADALKPPSKRERAKPKTSISSPKLVQLSGLQHEALAQLQHKLGTGFSATLLDGVTGSGKTEIYFELIEALAKDSGFRIQDSGITAPSPFRGDGRGGGSLSKPETRILNPESSPPQTLVLLPEIALSVQWLERYEKRFGVKPYVWHSGLTPAQRKHTWRAIAKGEANVVVGARSALFLPFANLQLMVVDEEHDASYKQEDGVIYQARDMAVARASFEKIPVVLVSATPSVETQWNVEQGKYGYTPLRERHAGASFAEPEIIDMRAAKLDSGAFIAPTLREALAQNLKNGNQSMLFLNRRGYAPLLLCRTCAHRFQCPTCSAWLVMHRKLPRLQCHHCGHTEPLPTICPHCSTEKNFYPCGPGVERIAEEVAAFLPEARLSVIASDALENLTSLKEKIADMEQGKTDILIGTQMVAKGHHFKNLTLVGIVDADMGLNGGDLRASERTYQLLHQLSGRAGREITHPGRVMIQSFLPTHPVMQALLSHDRDSFMREELAARQASHMPPFTRLAGIIMEDEKEEPLLAYAQELVRLAPEIQGLEILGPAPAPLYKLRNYYRYRILVKAERSLNVQTILTQWLAQIKPPHHLRLKVDIDPYSFL